MKPRLPALFALLSLLTRHALGMAPPTIPDVEVIDQDGQRRSFYSDLIRGEIVAVNFIFTECQTICPLSGALFGKLQQPSRDGSGPATRFISISLDPAHDTPERLKAWAARFGAGPRWTLVTGSKRNLDRLVKSLGAFTADKNEHPPVMLLGNDAGQRWQRVQGFPTAESVQERLRSLSQPDPGPPADPGSRERKAHPYFPDTILVDHQGREVRFFSDLIQGKVVVIQCFFSKCTQACPAMLSNFKQLQGRIDGAVHLLSITLDPENDTPERLGHFAEALGAESRWHFLSGQPRNVKEVLAKLGFATENIETHSNVFVIGNEPTGLWKKARGTATADEIAKIVQSVATDRP